MHSMPLGLSFLLEHDIRENPADWLWLQKKWKYAKPAAVDA